MSAKFKKFNARIHAVDKDGNPTKQGDTFVLRDDWQARATDANGRPFDPAIHEMHNDMPVLLSDGNIKVRPPRASGPAGMIDRMRLPAGLPTGYQYRWVNVDSRGRPAILEAEYDWSPVVMNGQQVRKGVGVARDGLTEAILMRKPQEWYDADQLAKDKRNASFERKNARIGNPDAEYVPDGRRDVLTESRAV